MTRRAEERETVIRFCDADDDVHIWSASPVFIRLMKRLGVEPTTVSMGQKPGDESYTWKVTQDWISVHRPIRRTLSPEQREVMAERMRSLRQHQTRDKESDPIDPEDDR